MAISAMAIHYQPYTVALMRIGDQFFGNMLYQNFSLSAMMNDAIIEGSDYYLYAMLRNGTFAYGEGNLNRMIVGRVPLFNSLTPIDLFDKNGILAAMHLDAQEAGFNYGPLMDTRELGFCSAHFYKIGTGLAHIDANVVQNSAIHPGVTYSRIDSRQPSQY